MAFQKAVPTSPRGAVNFVRGSGRTATWGVMILLGLGLLAFVLPFLKRVPLLGGMLGAGQAMIPGQGTAARTDQWGRRSA